MDPTEADHLAAIGAALDDGLNDCSSNLVTTFVVSGEPVTVTETAISTEYATIVDTAVVTETQTTTASIETQLYTVSSTVTIGTKTEVSTTVQTVVVTQTAVQTVTTTVPPFSSQAPLKARVQTLTVIPPYATAACESWDKYLAACKCAGAAVTTITSTGLGSTVTSTVHRTVTAPVLATIAATETDVIPVTATISATETVTVSVEATTTVVETDLMTSTTTITQTQTVTATAVPQRQCQNPTTSFRMYDDKAGATIMYIRGQLSDDGAGDTFWAPKAAGSNIQVQNSYRWVLDNGGNLMMLSIQPPYSNFLAAYVDIHPRDTVGLNIGELEQVLRWVREGQAVRVKGCVDPATGSLTLSGAGRENVFACSGDVRLSRGDASDAGVTCAPRHPKVELVQVV